MGKMYHQPLNMTSMKDWFQSNLNQQKNAEMHQRYAEIAIGDASQAGEEAVETATKETQRADRKLEERVQDLEFRQNELQIQKEASVTELDVLLVYKQRAQEALEACSEPLLITRKCSEQRKGRIGTELVFDPVTQCLNKEEQAITASQKELRHTVAQASEQARLLRANHYTLNADLGGKEAALAIDRHCSNLTPNAAELQIAMKLSKAEMSRSIKEWEFHTKQNIVESNYQVKQSRNLRSKIDLLLKTVYENISMHYENTNRAFNKRISETKDIKIKLENELAETTHHANNARSALTQLEEPIEVTEKHIALANTRLQNRTYRKGIEQCRDAVEIQLEIEIRELNKNLENLRRQYEQTEASLRCLRRSVEKLTEDLNKKINTLMIDEVQCMTQRLSMHFHLY